MAAIETLTWGYSLIEGPRVDAEDNLYFSDVREGGVYRRAPDGEITVAVPKRRGVGGIVLHADGGLVVGGRNLQHVKDGESRVVFDPDAPGFNDIVTDAQGRVLCGTIRTDPFDEGADQTPGECWRVGPDGTTEELYGEIYLTNGIGFSPDGTRIYHSDSAKRRIVSHDVDADGSVSNRGELYSGPKFFPDGLAVDEAGTVWVADVHAGGVRGIAADGSDVGMVEVPSSFVTSVCFGGADRRDLYIVTAHNREDESRGGTVFRTRVDVPGCEVPLARV